MADTPMPTSVPRGTSPSPAHDSAAAESWGAQKGTTSPQEAIANSPTKKPIDPSKP